MKTWADWYWLAWLGAVFGMFLPVELWAVFSGRSYDTLSDTMWKWTNVDLGHPFDFLRWTWPHWLLAIFMCWLTVHLVWGLLR